MVLKKLRGALNSRDRQRAKAEFQHVDRLAQDAAKAGALSFDLSGVSSYNMTKLPASIARLTDVTELALRNTGIASVKAISGLSKLEKLDLSYSRNLSDISPLSRLTNLKNLDLFRAEVHNLSPLRSLVNLKSLNIERVAAQDFTPLEALTGLEHLNLADTKIIDLSVLEGLTSLKSLSLWNTQATDFSPLVKLTRLESLDLWNTRISDVTPLAKLSRLQKINLSHTDVTEVTSLGEKTNLTYLALWNTPVQAQARGTCAYGGRWYDSDVLSFAGSGDLEAFKAAVARGAMVSEDQWEGPLHVAIRNGHIGICRFLLSLDLSIANDVAYYDGVYTADTALSLAIDFKRREIVELLLQHGVRIALSYEDPDFWDFDMEEMSGLHMSAAARANDIGLLQRFMKAGCPHDARDARGLTALHWAVGRECREAAHHLLNLWRGDHDLPPVTLSEMTDDMLSEALDQIGDPNDAFGYVANWRPGGC